MKKVIKYDYLISETNGKKTFIGKTIPYSDEALEAAKREAYEGEYKIEEIPDSEPSDIDILYEIEADQELRICCLEMGLSADDFA